jgi:hypothetical protein
VQYSSNAHNVVFAAYDYISHTIHRDAAILTLHSTARIAPQGILPPAELPTWAHDTTTNRSSSSSSGSAQLVCITGRTVSCSKHIEHSTHTM